MTEKAKTPAPSPGKKMDDAFRKALAERRDRTDEIARDVFRRRRGIVDEPEEEPGDDDGQTTD